jgi:hypothetical protein
VGATFNNALVYRPVEGPALGASMTTLQKEITESFLAKLKECKDIDAHKIEQLRALLEGGKKLKADDIIKILSLPAGGDLK